MSANLIILFAYAAVLAALTMVFKRVVVEIHFITLWIALFIINVLIVFSVYNGGIVFNTILVQAIVSCVMAGLSRMLVGGRQ